MVNEATFSVSGYVATQPRKAYTRSGQKMLYMRVGWTPRWLDRTTGEWTDRPTSFVSVTCFWKVAENAAVCLRRGDPVVLRGTLRVREYGPDDAPKRQSVEVIAEALGHDLSRGITVFNKHSERQEMTADELDRATPGGDGREPLPGDRPAAREAGDPGQDTGLAGGPEAGDRLRDEPDVDVEDLDDDEARQMMASSGELADPVGVSL